MNPTGRGARTLVFVSLLMLFIAWSVVAQDTPPPDDIPSPTETPLPPTTDPTLLTPLPTVAETQMPTETPLLPTTDPTLLTPAPTVTETQIPTETPLPPTTDPTLLTPPPTITETPQLTVTSTEVVTFTETPTLEGTPTFSPKETITLTVTPTASATWPVPPVPPRPPLDPVPQRPVGRSLLTGGYNDPRTFVGAVYAVVAPDDSNALQAIVDNAESTGACADYDIYLLEGEYVLEATLYLSSGCTISIFGRNEDGLELTFIQPDGSLEDTLIQVSDSSVLTLHNLTLRDAYAVAYGANTVGGAIRIYEGATLEVYDSVFENNTTSGFGGAIYNRAGQVFAYRTDFLANVGYVGSAYYSFGYSEEAQPYAQMECLRFEDNVVTQFTGAMAAYSFGYYSNIHDSSFINNTVQTEDIWDDSVVHIQSYAYKYSEPIDPVFNAQYNWWNRSTGPTGWEVAHDLINVINPKVDVDNWLTSAPSCPKQDPVPLPATITCTVTATVDQNVRSGPATTFAIIGQLFEGQQILVSALEEGWYQIYVDDVEHWINSQNASAEEACDGLLDTRVLQPSTPLNIGVYCFNVLMPAAAPTYCENDVYNNVRLVYEAFSVELGREPSLEEMLAITMQREWWTTRSARAPEMENYGTEGLSRNYFYFCNMPICTPLETLWSLSGYQPWRIGSSGIGATVDDLLDAYDDVSPQLANPSSDLSVAASTILNPSDPSWQTGRDDYRSWQWFNRDTSGTRPSEGTDPCTQVLLRVGSIQFEMYTAFQTDILNGNRTEACQ